MDRYVIIVEDLAAGAAIFVGTWKEAYAFADQLRGAVSGKVTVAELVSIEELVDDIDAAKKANS